jgi:hypothetical protein
MMGGYGTNATCAAANTSCATVKACCSSSQQCTPASWVSNSTYLCLNKPPVGGYGNFEVCQGAPGKAYVPYATPACRTPGYICTAATWVGQEKLCLPAPPAGGYKAGQRCAGVPGQAYVPYADCETGYACMEDAARGQGRYCVAKKY